MTTNCQRRLENTTYTNSNIQLRALQIHFLLYFLDGRVNLEMSAVEKFHACLFLILYCMLLFLSDGVGHGSKYVM
jgi:hypothetical protein